MAETDNTKLVKAAIKGSKDAYGSLVEAYQIYLYKTAFLYTKNQDDALDAVQDCVIKGMLGIGKLKEPAYFKTWLTRILIHCIYRSQNGKGKYIPLESWHSQDKYENYLIEEKLDLYDVIDTLKPQHKTVVILFYFQELKIREISVIMDIPEGTVKAYLYRAKKDIRNKLKSREEIRYAE